VAEIAQTDLRVQYYSHAENIGSINNFIHGMKQVNTPFFSFLSDDDILLPEFYQTAMAGFEKYSDAFLSVTAVIHTDEQGKFYAAPILSWKAGLYSPPDGFLAMLKYGHPTWTGTLFRTDVMKVIGILDAETGMLSDLDFLFRAAARFPIIVSVKPGAIFMVSPLGASRPWSCSAIWPGWLKIIRNIVEDDNIPPDVRAYARNLLTQRLKKRLFGVAIGAMIRKNFGDAHQSAEILYKHFNLKFQGLCLMGMAKLCKRVPFFCYCAFSANEAKRFILFRIRAIRRFIFHRKIAVNLDKYFSH
jgi:hypothetical protein